MPRFYRLKIVPDSLENLFEPNYYVVTSEKRFRRLYGSALTKPRVSFRHSIVLSVHRGLCDSGGFTVSIRDVRLAGRKLSVTVEYGEPAQDQNVTLTATYPLDAVVVPRQQIGGRGSYCAFFRHGEIGLAVVPFVI